MSLKKGLKCSRVELPSAGLTYSTFLVWAALTRISACNDLPYVHGEGVGLLEIGVGMHPA